MLKLFVLSQVEIGLKAKDYEFKQQNCMHIGKHILRNAELRLALGQLTWITVHKQSFRLVYLVLLHFY